MASSFDSLMSMAKRIYFVGIGGISMSSLAAVCKSNGYEVAGSDRTASDMTKKLRSAGIEVKIGHCEENIAGSDLVVYTGAIPEDNPELCAAKKNGIPTVPRAELLGWIMRSYPTRIGVSGAHGKSTTTAMLAHIFTEVGKNPTVLCGAETEEMNGACRIGGSENFIFEACEYKDSFLFMFPSVAVILNIDRDHTDYFEDLNAICRSFEKFSEIPFITGAKNPMLVACGDDENVREIAQKSPADVTFGINNKGCDYVATHISEKNGFYSFDIRRNGEIEGRITLDIPGYHNIYNALAAFAVSDMLQIPCGEICAAISSFEGALRRFEYKGKCGGAYVYVDYAHHPTEIYAAIKAAKQMAKNKKVTVIFEPHTYSRTADNLDGFAAALSAADFAVLLDIYAARETNVWNVSSEELSKMIPGACYSPSYDGAASVAKTSVEAGDIILILGAGTVYKIADMLV